MQRDSFFLSDSVNNENIDALSREQSVIFEKKICEISELADSAAALARELSDSGFGIYELLGFFSDEIDFSAVQPHSESMAKNIGSISSYLTALTAYDKAVFASLLSERLRKSGVGAEESDFLPEGDGNGSVIYVKNRLSDEAYDVFSDAIANATVSYADTLKAAAEAVSEGKCEFAILPLEEKGGARLAGIAALLFKYDLKIASVTPVFGFDGTADVKYALVSKKFKIPDVLPDDDRYVEIRLRSDGAMSLSQLFSAAEMLGATVYRINTVRFDTEEGGLTYYTVVFKGENVDFSALLLFLTLFAGAYTAIGIYKNLE